MFGIGQGELIFLILLAILILGPKRLPEATRTIAKLYHLLLRWKEEIQSQLSEIREEMEREAGLMEDLSLELGLSEEKFQDKRKGLDDYLRAPSARQNTERAPYSYKEIIAPEKPSLTELPSERADQEEDKTKSMEMNE